MRLDRRTVANIVAFLVASVVLTTLGLRELLNDPFADRLHLATVLPAAGGVREDFSVTLDGVVVGIVTDTSLVDDGVRVDVELDPGVSVPANVRARVVRATPIGEQRLDLQPIGDEGWEPLADGATVPAVEDPLPPVVSEVLESVVRLVDAVPTADLATVVDELTLMLDGREDDLRDLMVNGDLLATTLLESEDDLRLLLTTLPDVVEAVEAAGDDLEAAAADTRELTAFLVEHRGDVVGLLESGRDATAVGDTFLDATAANLLCLHEDLADLAEVLGRDDVLALVANTLESNQDFFVPLRSAVPLAQAADIGAGPHLQRWSRAQMPFPPPQEYSSSYEEIRPANATRPGGACTTERLGDGVPAASQPDFSAPYDGPGGVIEWPDGTTSTADDLEAAGAAAPAAAPSGGAVPLVAVLLGALAGCVGVGWRTGRRRG